jgi:hypothetical protein
MRAMAALKPLPGEPGTRRARSFAMGDPLGQTARDGCGRLGLRVSIGWLGESYGNDIAQIFVRLWRKEGPPCRSQRLSNLCRNSKVDDRSRGGTKVNDSYVCYVEPWWWQSPNFIGRKIRAIHRYNGGCQQRLRPPRPTVMDQRKFSGAIAVSLIASLLVADARPVRELRGIPAGRTGH